MRETGIKAAAGDVVGCGINFATGMAFWTLNGEAVADHVSVSLAAAVMAVPLRRVRRRSKRTPG